MVEHLVFFELEEAADFQEIKVKLLELKSIIPEILEISAGDNFSERSDGYNMGLRVKLADKMALSAYRDHPAHQSIVENVIKPNLKRIVAVDYEY